MNVDRKRGMESYVYSTSMHYRQISLFSFQFERAFFSVGKRPVIGLWLVFYLLSVVLRTRNYSGSHQGEPLLNTSSELRRTLSPRLIL